MYVDWVLELTFEIIMSKVRCIFSLPAGKYKDRLASSFMRASFQVLDAINVIEELLIIGEMQFSSFYSDMNCLGCRPLYLIIHRRAYVSLYHVGHVTLRHMISCLNHYHAEIWEIYSDAW